MITPRCRELGDGDEDVGAREGEVSCHLREPDVVAYLKAHLAPRGRYRRYRPAPFEVGLLDAEGVDLLLKTDPRLVEAKAPVQPPVDEGADDHAAVILDEGPKGVEGWVGGPV